MKPDATVHLVPAYVRPPGNYPRPTKRLARRPGRAQRGAQTHARPPGRLRLQNVTRCPVRRQTVETDASSEIGLLRLSIRAAPLRKLLTATAPLQPAIGYASPIGHAGTSPARRSRPMSAGKRCGRVGTIGSRYLTIPLSESPQMLASCVVFDLRTWHGPDEPALNRSTQQCQQEPDPDSGHRDREVDPRHSGDIMGAEPARD